MFVKVIIQKSDLDTCMTAYLLNVSREDDVFLTRGEACEADLNNPHVVCIEAGGNGQIHLNNFDHHNDSTLPPASVQAMETLGIENNEINRLVDYVARVDMAQPFPRPIPFPSLSNVFSGMKMVEQSEIEQFFKGIDMLSSIITLRIDPFQSMPKRKAWAEYIAVKERNWKELKHNLNRTQFYHTQQNRKVGYCSQRSIGGIGALLNTMGCDIAILYSDTFGPRALPKFTIGSRSISLDALLAKLNGYEPGWGGHQRIIGSPREAATTLKPQQIISIVIDIL